MSQTYIGTITQDPELKFVGANGTAVVNFSIACNDRRYNKTTGQWEDGETTYLDIVGWKQLAENIAENLTKGTRVIVVGKIKQETWEKDGQKRSRLKVEAEEVGASLKFASKAKADPWASSSVGR